MAKLKWGILGAGNIARAFARGVVHSQTGELVAVGSRTQESADKFGEEFGLTRRHASYEALLADPEVEAVYIATPHPFHAEWAIRAAEAKKHILCEKPIALNQAHAMAMIEAAQRNDVFLMEAFMYRCHPQIAKLVELLRANAIGKVRMVQATFGFSAGFSPEGRLFKNALGGGGILDVGCYATSMARLVAGVAMGQDFAEPTEVHGVGRIGETGVDEWTTAVAKFPGDIIAQVTTAVRMSPENVVRIFGSEGMIYIPDPWIPNREGGASIIHLTRWGEEPKQIEVTSSGWLYGLEADTVAANLANRQAAPPAMTWADTMGNMRMLDMWRDAIGLVYDAERFDAPHPPVFGRPLAICPKNVMKYGEIKGVGKPVSRLIMGCDNQRTMSHAAVMFDDFFSRGGNCFDTAYIYGGGLQEKLLGQWVKNRGVREQVVMIGKGAHTPDCYPDRLTSQLLETLERMQTDHVDIYLMHRDNPEVPVGEFIEVLNEHVKAGRIGAFGGSNWALSRVEEANAYAAAKGLQGMSAVSNNFSLARMIDAVWTGCIAASDPESRAWLTKTQLPLLSWSSQARGFFTERASPDDHSDPELVRCWYSPDNFKARDRAIELAAKKGVAPVTIAAAYVLCQPFPTFALIGPRQLSETRTSFQGLEIELTPEEVRWLAEG
jgi:predicted dehydrogenase/aryl-alcohol dehydrogenase-like predicted oxidoreductase